MGKNQTSHRPTSKKGQETFNPLLYHFIKIYSTFTLWPTGARDRVVVDVLVDSLLGLFHQPALSSPVPTIRSVPDLLVLLRGVQILFVTRGGARKVQKDGKPNGSTLADPCTVEDIPRQ